MAGEMEAVTSAMAILEAPRNGTRPERPRLRLHEEVTQQLAEWIVAVRLAAGSALPSEGELAARFGVSRATVREAVKVLAARGLIEVRHGVGLFVGGSTAQPVSDALTLVVQRD